MRVLSVTHGPTVPGGVFDEAVESAGHALERWVVPDGGTPNAPGSYGAVMVFGGSMHPDEDDRFGWLAGEADEVYAMFNNNRDDFAPRSAAILRGLLDETGVAASGGIEPPPREPTLF